MNSWQRPYFRESPGQPLLYFVVFGNFAELGEFEYSKYHSNGLPEGFDLRHCHRPENPEFLARFLDGYTWEKLIEEDPELSERIQRSDECFILNGEIDDQIDLNYLRDAVGIIAFILDHGGVAVYDPQILGWFSAETWRHRFFEPREAFPRRHATILVSDEGTKRWFHTRGMRKFGRPDLSVRDVVADFEVPTLEVLNRFIEFMGFGGVIEESSEVRVAGFPEGFRCFHAGDLDDPDFNNFHVEIKKVEQVEA